jgi:hypothetical protein
MELHQRRVMDQFKREVLRAVSLIIEERIPADPDAVLPPARKRK